MPSHVKTTITNLRAKKNRALMKAKSCRFGKGDYVNADMFRQALQTAIDTFPSVDRDLLDSQVRLQTLGSYAGPGVVLSTILHDAIDPDRTGAHTTQIHDILRDAGVDPDF